MSSLLTLTAAIWLGLSLFVLVNRLLHDRRQARIDAISASMVEATTGRSDAGAFRWAFSGLSRRAVYRMIALPSINEVVAAACARHCLERWGDHQMLRDASGHTRRTK